MSPAFIPLDELPMRKRARSPEPQAQSESGFSQQPSPSARAAPAVPEYNPALPFGLFGYGGSNSFGSSPFAAIKQGNSQSSAQYANGSEPPCAKRPKVDVTKPVTSHCSSPAPRRSTTSSLRPAPPSSASANKKTKKLRASSRSPSPPALTPLTPEEALASARAHQIAHAVRQATLQAQRDRDAAAAANKEARQWRAFQRRSPRFVHVKHIPTAERKGHGNAPRWRDQVSPLLRQAVGWQEGEGRRFGEEVRALEGALAGIKAGRVDGGSGGW